MEDILPNPSARTARARRGLARPAIGVLIVLAVASNEAVGQFRGGRLERELRPALIPRNAVLENLLRTAEDALTRQDWKLAIDSLQRIIDDDAGALLPAPQNAPDAPYEVRASARRRALAMLAAMPAPGLEAYRLLHDGRAESLWRRVVDSGDRSALTALVERFLVTSRGDDAADLLAALLIDRGMAADALDVLDRLAAWCPDSDIPKSRIALKRAACWWFLGDGQRAENALDAIEDSPARRALAALLEDQPEGPAGTLRPATDESWPRVTGDPRGTGRMPAISPELKANLPWRYMLPSDEPDWWDREFLARGDGSRALPVSSAVVDAGRVFVKNLGRVAALDLESLEVLWQAEPTVETEAVPRFRRSRRFRGRNERIVERYTIRDRLLHDYVGSAVAVVDELVFEIDREGASPYVHAELDFSGNPDETGQTVRGGSRLVARGVESGTIQWQRGRTGMLADPLGDVFFLSVPIEPRAGVAADDERVLWVVYARRNDVYLGVLDFAQGGLRREMLLCSVDMRELGELLHHAVYPTTDGRTLYLSMPVGLVLAVDVETFSLRWATSYPREPHVAGGLEPKSWLCGPARISGRWLIAAPPDSADLLALDRSTGDVLWTHARGAAIHYVLGVDDRHVWLGGDAFTCLDLANGAEVWRAFDGAALRVTGKAALSGDAIHIPTRQLLITLDARTGELRQEQDLPDDQLPLGNLLCLASAMFSTDTNELRKFPDLTLSYPRQLARFEANPRDPRAAIRLAWMELLRDEPRRAFEVLEQASGRVGGDGRYRNDVARLRIDAILRMAAQPEMDDRSAIAHLRDAAELTSSGFDRLRATLALAARLRRVGELEEAYLTLWRLGLTEAGDGYVTVEQKLRNQARLVIARALARGERDLTARQLKHIADATMAELDRAAELLAVGDDPAPALRRLVQLAELDDAGGAGQQALVLLGNHAYDAGRFERSEQYYREAIRRDRVSRITADATCALAAQYLDPQQDLPGEAWRLLETLSGPSSPTSGAAPSERVTALRRRIDPAKLAEALAHHQRGRFRLAERAVNESPPSMEATSLIEFAGGGTEAAGRAVLLWDAPNRVRSTRPRDFETEWTAELRLCGTALTELDEQTTAHRGNDRPPHAVVRCDGQTAVINGPDGLFGFGLLTGRRLWGIPYEEARTAEQLALRNRLVALDRGRLVCAPRRGLLTCAAVIDGRQPLWERILPEERIDTVFLKDGFCFTLDNLRQSATVYAADTGKWISNLRFVQPDDTLTPIPLIYTDYHVVGPAGPQTLVCYSVRGGAENWRYAMPSPLRWTFNAGAGYVGAGSADGSLRLLDVLAGDVVLEARIDENAEGNAEGIIVDDTLLVMATAPTTRGHQPTLTSYDLATGEQRWRRDGFGSTGASQYALWKLMHVARDVIPIYRRMATNQGSELQQRAGLIAVEVIDKRTGDTVGAPVSTGRHVTLSEQLNGEFGLWPGRMLVGTRRGIVALDVVDEAAATAPPAEGDVQ
jgi:outer membrane protein assembly factor BamB